jgi:signal transduction histidine kinase
MDGANSTHYFNLGPRLAFTFATLIVLILAGNALVVWQFHLTRNQTDRLTGANQQLIEVLRLQASLLSFHRRLDDLALSMDVRRLDTEAESLRRALHVETQQTRTAIANLRSGTVVDPSFLPTLDTIDVTLPSELEAILGLAKSGNWAVIHPRLGNELSPIETQTAALVNSINQQASGELARAVGEMRNVQRRILVIVPATALSTFLIAALLGWSFARRIIELRLDERVNERTRIARELHDTLLQSFQGLLLRFQVVYELLPGRPAEAKQDMQIAIDRTIRAIEEGRGAVQGLRTGSVEGDDLAVAIETLAEDLTSGRPGDDVVVRVDLQGTSRPLRAIVRDEIYHIGGEALRNCLRHGHASEVEVELRYGERQLRLRVRDNGSGIDPKFLSDEGAAGHFGLHGMRERAELIGGKLTIWTAAASGTEIELTVPAARAYAAGSSRRFAWLTGRLLEATSDPAHE